MLAALLGLAQATFVSQLELQADRARARCVRETDAGMETISIPLPAVITADLRLNEPRYVALPGILKARSKPLSEIPLADLGVDARARTTLLRCETPPARKAGVRVRSVQELVERLRNEARVI
jgi:electron transfer flavoprotein beta subunit